MERVLKPVIEDYFCYRKYLADFFSYKKLENPNYSYRVFTSKAGLKSSGHPKMIMNGDRNIGDKTLPMYQKAIGFSKKTENDYFRLLVQYDQTQDLKQKTEFFEQILKLKEKKGSCVLQASQYKLLSQSHIVTIYVLIGLDKFNATIDSIQERLVEKISRPNIEKAVLLLLEIDLIKVDDGYYVQKDGAVSTPDEIKALAVNKYHESMIKLSLESLKKDKIDERNFSGVTIGIDESKFEVVCEKINCFRKELNELMSDDVDASRVYQLNMNFFPLTKPELKEVEL